MDGIEGVEEILAPFPLDESSLPVVHVDRDECQSAQPITG